ncbi:hypothetical protein K435DRAFT_849225 [Dendrothele bispora CBS 962.96]|uniref:Uncharacterized protein n=1 Tax=Dendrothele bispora (strain CBS 962.96) TaxID=1314807 RepID=A0A4S8MSL5_DENBC|nr:hypothetical protein K435DRAFT_849225 [Dendrothele bispora CBS 962.96]
MSYNPSSYSTVPGTYPGQSRDVPNKPGHSANPSSQSDEQLLRSEIRVLKTHLNDKDREINQLVSAGTQLEKLFEESVSENETKLRNMEQDSRATLVKWQEAFQKSEERVKELEEQLSKAGISPGDSYPNDHTARIEQAIKNEGSTILNTIIPLLHNLQSQLTISGVSLPSRTGPIPSQKSPSVNSPQSGASIPSHDYQPTHSRIVRSPSLIASTLPTFSSVSNFHSQPPSTTPTFSPLPVKPATPTFSSPLVNPATSSSPPVNSATPAFSSPLANPATQLPTSRPFFHSVTSPGTSPLPHSSTTSGAGGLAPIVPRITDTDAKGPTSCAPSMPGAFSDTRTSTSSSVSYPSDPAALNHQYPGSLPQPQTPMNSGGTPSGAASSSVGYSLGSATPDHQYPGSLPQPQMPTNSGELAQSSSLSNTPVMGVEARSNSIPPTPYGPHLNHSSTLAQEAPTLSGSSESGDKSSLQSKVRTLTKSLFGLTSVDNGIYQLVEAGCWTSQADADAFRDNVPGSRRPTIKEFRPYWVNMSHPWNVELQRLFMEHFLQRYPEHNASSLPIVEAHYKTRMTRLRSLINDKKKHG